MSNVVSLRPARRSTWAAKHLEFMEAAFAQLAGHLADLSDEQLAVERDELHRLMADCGLQDARGARGALFAYMDEAERRKSLPGFPGSGVA